MARREPGVSILVFLEWPLGLVEEARYVAERVVFQSLFFWNGLWDSMKVLAS